MCPLCVIFQDLFRGLARTRRIAALVLLALACLLGGYVFERRAAGQEPAAEVTTVTIPNMHCESCAKKIRNQLFTLRNVYRVTTNVKETTARIEPRKDRAVSAFDIWTKLENAKFAPSKLVGPEGEFTAKPASPSPAPTAPKAAPAST